MSRRPHSVPSDWDPPPPLWKNSSFEVLYQGDRENPHFKSPQEKSSQMSFMEKTPHSVLQPVETSPHPHSRPVEKSPQFEKSPQLYPVINSV